jgi:hypothetical protein
MAARNKLLSGRWGQPSIGGESGGLRGQGHQSSRITRMAERHGQGKTNRGHTQYYANIIVLPSQLTLFVGNASGVEFSVRGGPICAAVPEDELNCVRQEGSPA